MYYFYSSLRYSMVQGFDGPVVRIALPIVLKTTVLFILGSATLTTELDGRVGKSWVLGFSL